MALDVGEQPEYWLSFVFTFFLNTTHFSLKNIKKQKTVNNARKGRMKYELKQTDCR